MVSTDIAKFLFPLLLAASALAQSPTTPLNAEQRGDILMARKMYREAIDVYKEGDLTSAIIWNKLGIAYHQLQDFNSAKVLASDCVGRNPEAAQCHLVLGVVQARFRNAQMTPDTVYMRA